MKFLIDVCAGTGVGMWLLQEGHDVLLVRDRDPRMEDEDILAWAHLEKRIIVSIDKDFGRLIFVEFMPHDGIIRLPNVNRETRIKLVRQIVATHSDDLEKGAIITATRTKIRVRRTP
jgi:predicted nuclease of predicted toxin-antitoxin system